MPNSKKEKCAYRIHNRNSLRKTGILRNSFHVPKAFRAERNNPPRGSNCCSDPRSGREISPSSCCPRAEYPCSGDVEMSSFARDVLSSPCSGCIAVLLGFWRWTSCSSSTLNLRHTTPIHRISEASVIPAAPRRIAVVAWYPIKVVEKEMSRGDKSLHTRVIRRRLVVRNVRSSFGCAKVVGV